MSAATMDVNAEARRILAVSVSKLYASRAQRGGLRLHRSLLLSLVMRSARDIYHSSTREIEPPEQPMDTGPQADVDARNQTEPDECETTEDKENLGPERTRASRKRRGKVSAAPDFLPSKRARLESGEERYALPGTSCRAGDCLTALTQNRVIAAF